MKKVLTFTKNHFVETIGFLVILFLIIFISFLKYYKKTFTCEITESENNIKVYQKYIIKQKNNNIKSISYYYKVTSPDKNTVKQITNFYKELINQNNDLPYDNQINLKYKNNKLILTYNVPKNEIKNNELYKSTRHLVKSLKASNFTCK